MVEFTDGIQYLDGSPIMMRDSHLASLNFSQLSETFNAIPSYKFLYYVRFVSSSAESDTSLGSIISTDGSANNSYISFAVKNVTRPNVTFQTRTLNQYNKHRIVQTRSEFDPITINFHDTVDNRVLQLFKSYYVHYYKDALNTEYTAWYDDVINNTFNQGQGWGFEPTFDTVTDGHYFDKIEIYKMYGGYYTMMSCIHPIITRLGMDNFDYADTSGLNQVTMTLAYEGLTFDVQNPTELTSDLISEMGLDLSDYYEPYNESPVSGINFTSFTSDDLYGSGSDLNIGSQLTNFLGGALSTVLNEATSGQKVSIGSALKGSLMSTIGSNVNNTRGSLLYDGLSGLTSGESGSEILQKYGYNMLNSGIVNTEHNSSNNNFSLRGLNLFTGG